MKVPRPTVRDELLRLAQRLAATPLTLVVAPAGSGKTMLLDDWRGSLASSATPVASLDLVRWHDDVVSLGSDLVDALAVTLPGVGESTRMVLASLADPAHEWPSVARSLLREIPAHGPPLVFFLDGVEELEPSSPGAALLDALVGDAPPTLRLVIASRGVLPPAVARRALVVPPIEVRADDLSLRAHDVARTLEAHGVEASDTLVTQLLARTEGWATGVVLGARLLARTPPAERGQLVFELGSDLTDYIGHEVLADETRESLALLEAGALVGDASLAELASLAALVDAKGVVESALRRGLLSERAGRLRVAAPWRVVLRNRVLARDDDASRALRDRAVERLVERGAADEACLLLAEARDGEALGALLRRLGMGLIGMGRRASVLRWLESVPRAQRERDPDLLRLEATARIASEPGQAEQLIQRARALSSREGGGRPSASADGTLIMLYVAQGRMPEARALVRETHPLRGVVRDPAVRGAVVVGLAGRAHLARRYTRSLWLSERAARFPLASPLRWLNAMNHAYLLALSGRFDRARAVTDELLADPILGRLAGSSASLRSLRALAAAHAEDQETARSDVRRAAAEVGSTGFGPVTLVIDLAAGQTYALLGETSDARARFEAALARATSIDQHAVVGIARTGLAQLALREGDRMAARELALHADAAFRSASARSGLVQPWCWTQALALLAASGDSETAARRLDDERMLVQRTGLAGIDRLCALLRASIAREAGDSEAARRLAAEAWRITLASDLSTVDRLAVSADDVFWTAAEAIAGGIDAARVIARVRTIDPRRAATLLDGLLAHRSREVRLRAIAAIAADGDRRFDAALRGLVHDRDARVRTAAERARASLDPRPRHRLRIVTLGALRVLRGDDEVAEAEWRGVTARRVLLRLLDAGERGLSRERMIEDLWPDADPENARNHLRVAVSRLHDILEPERPDGMPPYFVLATGDVLQLRREVFDAWDVVRFERLADAVAPGRGPVGDEELARLREVFDACPGPLAPGMTDEPWLSALRARVEERLARIAERFGAALIERGAIEAAEAVATRWLEVSPLDERATALRMRGLLVRGDRIGALRCFDQVRVALARSLGVAPGDAIEALARKARGERAGG